MWGTPSVDAACPQGSTLEARAQHGRTLRECCSTAALLWTPETLQRGFMGVFEDWWTDMWRYERTQSTLKLQSSPPPVLWTPMQVKRFRGACPSFDSTQSTHLSVTTFREWMLDKCRRARDVMRTCDVSDMEEREDDDELSRKAWEHFILYIKMAQHVLQHLWKGMPEVFTRRCLCTWFEEDESGHHSDEDHTMDLSHHLLNIDVVCRRRTHELSDADWAEALKRVRYNQTIQEWSGVEWSSPLTYIDSLISNSVSDWFAISVNTDRAQTLWESHMVSFWEPRASAMRAEMGAAEYVQWSVKQWNVEHRIVQDVFVSETCPSIQSMLLDMFWPREWCESLGSSNPDMWSHARHWTTWMQLCRMFHQKADVVHDTLQQNVRARVEALRDGFVTWWMRSVEAHTKAFHGTSAEALDAAVRWTIVWTSWQAQWDDALNLHNTQDRIGACADIIGRMRKPMGAMWSLKREGSDRHVDMLQCLMMHVHKLLVERKYDTHGAVDIKTKLMCAHELQSAEMDAFVTSILSNPVTLLQWVVEYIHDRDRFLEMYRVHLSHRLVSHTTPADFSMDMDMEAQLVGIMKLTGAVKEAASMEIMVNDMNNSFTVQDDHNKHHVTVLTTALWPAGLMDCVHPRQLCVPDVLSTCWDRMHTFIMHAKAYNGRTVEPVWTRGSVELRWTIESRRVRVHMHTLQALICLHMDQHETQKTQKTNQKGVAISALAEACGLELSVLKRLLAPLCISPKGEPSYVLRNITAASRKGKKRRTFQKDDLVCIAPTLPPEKRRAAVLRVKCINFQVAQQQKRIEEVVHVNRQHRIDALVVRLMKTKKHMTQQQLVSDVISQIMASATSFPVKPRAIKLRIEALIERDYLERSEEDNQQLMYLA